MPLLGLEQFALPVHEFGGVFVPVAGEVAEGGDVLPADSRLPDRQQEDVEVKLAPPGRHLFCSPNSGIRILRLHIPSRLKPE